METFILTKIKIRSSNPQDLLWCKENNPPRKVVLLLKGQFRKFTDQMFFPH